MSNHEGQPSETKRAQCRLFRLRHGARCSPERPAKQPSQKLLITVSTPTRVAVVVPETDASTLPLMSYWVMVKVPENTLPFGPSTTSSTRFAAPSCTVPVESQERPT